MARKRSSSIKAPEAKLKRAKGFKTTSGNSTTETINPNSFNVEEQYQTPSDGISDMDASHSHNIVNDNRKRSRMVQAWSEPEIEFVLECVQRLHDKSKRVFKISMFDEIAPMFENKFDVAVHGKQLQSMFKTVRKCHRYFSSLLQRDGMHFDKENILMTCAREFYDTTIKEEVRVMPYITVNIMETEAVLSFAHFIIMQQINPTEDSSEFPDISNAMKRQANIKQAAGNVTMLPNISTLKEPSAVIVSPSPESNIAEDDSDELASGNSLVAIGNNKRPRYGVKKVLKKRAKITKDLLDVVHRLEHLDDTREEQSDVLNLLAAVIESNKAQSAAIDALSARFDQIETMLAQLANDNRKKKTKPTVTSVETATA